MSNLHDYNRRPIKDGRPKEGLIIYIIRNEELPSWNSICRTFMGMEGFGKQSIFYLLLDLHTL